MGALNGKSALFEAPSFSSSECSVQLNRALGLVCAMPARIMPTGRADPANSAADASNNAPSKRQQTSQLTVCISLASLFDFEKTGFVTQSNWQKGMATLMLEELGMDEKIWSHLTGIHGSKDMASKGQLAVQSLTDVVPIDPRVSVLLQAIVKGLVGLDDFVKRTLRKEVKDTDIKRNRAILNVRRRIMQPCLQAWRNLLRENKKIFKRSVHHARYATHFRAWRTWVDAVAMCHEEARDKRQKERQNKRVRGAALRMTNSKLTAAWNSWIEQWHERKQYIKAVGRLANRPLSMAYNSWVEMREQGLFLRRIAKRSLNRDLSKGWKYASHRLQPQTQARAQPLTHARTLDATSRPPHTHTHACGHACALCPPLSQLVDGVSGRPRGGGKAGARRRGRRPPIPQPSRLDGPQPVDGAVEGAPALQVPREAYGGRWRRGQGMATVDGGRRARDLHAFVPWPICKTGPLEGV